MIWLLLTSPAWPLTTHILGLHGVLIIQVIPPRSLHSAFPLPSTPPPFRLCLTNSFKPSCLTLDDLSEKSRNQQDWVLCPSSATP